MLTDLRFALRQFAKAPGSTAIIILTLALGIGASTAIYSALDSIVLHPWDDPATDRSVFIQSVKSPQGVEGGLSVPDFLDLEKQGTSFEFMARARGQSDVLVTGTEEPLRLNRVLVSPRYFDILGIKMDRGRTFLPEEFVSGKDNVLILSYACWQRAFGGAPDIIGRTLNIDDRPCTVVGVLSGRFDRTGNYMDVWVPLPTNWLGEPGRDPRGVRGSAPSFGRLRPGVTLERAQSELDVIASNLAKKYPDTNTGYSLRIGVLNAEPSLVTQIQVLFGAVGCLMLIACANVASLLLVRANARQREMSVRAALGASRGRLIRQLLTENVLLALAGGAGGILLAQWALDFIRTFIPSGGMNVHAAPGGFMRLAYLELDGSVLVFALGLSVATALIFGLAPAWLSSAADLSEALKQGTRGSTEGRSRGRLRATLVICEIAAAVTLLACSGLLIRSFLKLTAYDPGFDPKHRAVVRLSLPRYAKPEQQITFVRELMNALENEAGVAGVAATTYFPLVTTGPVAGIQIEGASATAVAERPLAYSSRVTPDYFRTMGIPLKQGRSFSNSDDAKSPRVAIINQTLARQHFPNENPVGRRITLANGSDGWCEIIGVVGDVGQNEVREVPPPQIYEPHAQTAGRNLRIVVRAHGDPSLLYKTIKSCVRALDPNLPIGEMNSVEYFLHTKLTPDRLTLYLLGAFAGIGLFIAAIGIYGVIAFTVSQRTAEIGIRMALGAQPGDVLRLILRQGARLVGVGFAVGIIATFVVGRGIEAQLYNTSGHDPISLASITLFFAAVAALACWLPARRATKIDPIVALRSE